MNDSHSRPVFSLHVLLNIRWASDDPQLMDKTRIENEKKYAVEQPMISEN